VRVHRALVAVHRDVGYFFAALTVIYAVSGVAVNHVEDWNPSYALKTVRHDVGALPAGAADQVGAEVLRRLTIAETPRSSVRVGDRLVKIFLDERTLTVALPEGTVVEERRRRRPGLFEANFLHLNRGKGWWTWFADAYAIGLAVLALTGIFVVKGRRGLPGRGKWLLLAGLAIPLLYLLL
jgi:hypothetical protein